MSVTIDRVRELIQPLLGELDVELYDIDHVGGSLRITLDRPGGIDVDAITRATRSISSALDEADVVPGAYTLEVSSPGIERSLRTVAHFEGAIGEDVKLKTRPGIEGDRRAEGRLVSVADGRVTIEGEDGTSRTLPIDDIERAHTVYDWTPPPKPGKSQQGKQKSGQQPKPKPSTDAADHAAPSTITNPTDSEATP